MGVLVTGVTSVLVTGAYHPVPRIVVEGVAVLVHDILAVAFMGLAFGYGVTTSGITILSFLDLFGLLLVLGLGFTMSPDLGSSLPSLELTHGGGGLLS